MKDKQVETTQVADTTDSKVITLILSKPLNITDGKSFFDANKIEILPHTYNDKKYCRKLKQLTMRAMQSNMLQTAGMFSTEQIEEMQVKKASKEGDPEEPVQVETVEEKVASFKVQVPSSNVDYDVYLNTCSEFLLNTTVVTLGGQPLTRSLVRQIDDEDIANIVYTFIANFIPTSL